MDFTVTDHGSIFLLRPNSAEAKAWISDHLQVEQYQMFGEAVAVEHRYIGDILEGVHGADLTFEGP